MSCVDLEGIVNTRRITSTQKVCGAGPPIFVSINY